MIRITRYDYTALFMRICTDVLGEVHMIKWPMKYKWYIVVILVLIIIEPAITSWMVLWVQKIYNTVQVGTNRLFILKMLLTGVLVWVCKRLLLFSISVVKARFICNIKQDLKRDIFEHAFGLNTASIAQIGTSGEYISIFTNDITIIEQRFFSNIIGAITKFFSIVILGSTFLSMNRKLALIMFIFAIIVMLVPPVFARRLNKVNLAYSKSLSKITQKLKEYLQAYATIKNYSIEHVIMQKFNAINAEVEDSKFKYDCSLSLADSIGSLLTWFTTIIVIGAGLIMVSKGEILIGTVIASQAFSEELAAPLQGIIENVNSIKSVKSITEKIKALTSDDVQEGNSVASIHTAVGHEINIEFRNLTVSFDNRNIIDNFSFNFQQGGKYLIIGKNGSGKSSIFKALKKRFRSYKGQIFVNGVELSSFTNEELSDLVSYLNENVSIFSGSIEENVMFGRRVSKEQYNNAIRDAHVELNAKRYVGEDGFNISSGEQRKIEIARTLISPAKFIIFDEVISTLDIETAYDIEKMALNYDDKTVVFISHNFSGKLIREYDEILVMVDGSLVAHGTYDDLIMSNEYFRTICEIKFGINHF